MKELNRRNKQRTKQEKENKIRKIKKSNGEKEQPKIKYLRWDNQKKMTPSMDGSRFYVVLFCVLGGENKVRERIKQR